LKHQLRKLIFWPLLAALLVALAACPTMDQLTRSVSVPGSPRLDEDTIIAGLKEALQVGARNAVEAVSRTDGYYASPLIKILLPPELEKVGDKLSDLGMERKVDEFVLSMNRAAERAATEALDIFVDAVLEMSLEDARSILSGADNAATVYFEEHTRDQLARVFLPHVSDSMDKVGLTRLFKLLMDTYNAIPFVEKQSFDLDAYVTAKALDGLFTVIAAEEKKIRTDPAARITELLRKVFA
jgi:hypothetical protein